MNKRSCRASFDNLKSKTINRKWGGFWQFRLALGVCGNGRRAAAEESPTDRIPVQYLPFRRDAAWSRHFGRDCASLATLRDKTSLIEYRFAEGKFDRLSDLAADLVRLKVRRHRSTGGTPPALAAKKATTTIPIVLLPDGDPVGTGLVASLARPGGNITGLSNMHVGLKRETAGAAQRGGSQSLACVRSLESGIHSAKLALRETEVAGRALRGAASIPGGANPKDLEPAFPANEHSTCCRSPCDRLTRCFMNEHGLQTLR